MTAPLVAPRPGAHRLPDATQRALRAALRQELDVQRAQLTEARSELEELTRQADVHSQLEREFAERAAQRAEEVIAEVTLALGRLEDGTHGVCEGCGNDVAVERLHAIPFTRHCVPCSARAPRLLG
jgi:DnaK suppressor protein